MNFILILGSISILLNLLVSGTRISQMKCDEYRKYFPTQYYNGEDAVPKEFPFMAKISNSTQYLSGILVSENFVLSVAFVNFSKAVVYLGDLGSHTDVDDAKPKTYKVINTFAHPAFNEYYSFADIKLYQLNESVQFNEYVRPACLSLPKLIPDYLMQIGWGNTNVRNNNNLHKISLDYISNERCKNIYKVAGSQSQIVVQDIDKNEIFCARSRRGRRRMTLGIGSALIRDDGEANALDEVIGFLDYSTKGKYDVSVAVFVRIAAYIDWIESIVWPGQSTSTAAQSETIISSMKFISLIIATIVTSLMLCVLIVYFSLFRSK